MLVKSNGYNEFFKRKDFGSPLPTNKTLLPFQTIKKRSAINSIVNKYFTPPRYPKR